MDKIVFNIQRFASAKVISGNNRTISAAGNYTVAKGFTGTITINTTGAVTIDGASAGELSNVNIVTASNTANLTIKDLKVKNTNEANIIKFGKGTGNKLNIAGKNTLTNTESMYQAGINVGGGLTIDGKGSLDVALSKVKVLSDGKGGVNFVKAGEGIASVSVSIASSNAAIGSDFREFSSANITINGGTINTSTRGSGAAIGGGNFASIGDIKINGGTINAYSDKGAGIGNGLFGWYKDGKYYEDSYYSTQKTDYNVGNISIGGNAVVVAVSDTGTGIGNGGGGEIKNITINGNANVTATSLGNGAGIGTGADWYSVVGDILIGGKAKVSATSKYGAGIGGSGVIGNSSAVGFNSVKSITITDQANVKATSEEYGAGIGGGSTSSGYKGSATSTFKLESITISGDATVTATSNKNGVGIGAGSGDSRISNNIGNINISGKTSTSAKSTVTINNDNTLQEIKINGKKYSATQLVFKDGKYIAPTKDKNVTYGTEGKDNIYSTINGATINALGGNDYIYSGYWNSTTGNNVSINAGVGNDNIYNYANNVTLNGDNGDDYFCISKGTNIKIDGGNGNDDVYNYGEKVTINGGSGNDGISNYGNSVSINGGAGNDSIGNQGNSISISGGAGDDSIALSKNIDYSNTSTDTYSKNVTITGGTGVDTIENYGKNNVVYQYASGDGNDSVFGFNSGDTVHITSGTVKNVSVSGSDVIVNVGTGSLYLKQAVGKKFKIKTASGSVFETVAGSSSGKVALKGYTEKFLNKENKVTVTALADYTSHIFNTGSNVSIKGVTTQGNVSVTNYGNNVTIDNNYYTQVYNHGDNVAINVATHDSWLYNYGGDNVTITGGKDDDYIYTSYGHKNIKIEGGKGLDTISSYSNYVTISGGADNDSIRNSGERVSIHGGTGDDTIVNGYSYYSYALKDVTINGGAGNDNIQNYSSNGVLYQYKTGGGNDTITGYNSGDTIQISGSYTRSTVGNNVLVKVGSGSILLTDAKYKAVNIVTINGGVEEEESKLITGTKKADTIENILIGATINALDGNDYIKNGRNTTGNTRGNNSIINAGKGNDAIYNYAQNVTIDGGAGEDYIDSSFDSFSVSINGGDGNDYMDVNSDNSTIDGGKGNDSIENWSDNDIVNGGDGNDSINQNGSSKVTVYSGAGNDTIYNQGSDVKIYAEAGDDSVYSQDANVTISGGAGNDILWNFSYGNANNVKIDGDAGKDWIYNQGGKKLTINGGADDDYIDNSGRYVGSTYVQADNNLITGGAGNDYISNYKSNKSTINGGTGNDTIYNTDSSNTTFLYSNGDGNDIIYGWISSDSLKIGNGTTDTYAKATVGSDVLVSVGSGVITLSGAAGVSGLKILGKEQSAKSQLIVGTEGADKIKNTDSNVTIKALGGNDTVSNTGVSVTAYLGKGNDSIYNTGKRAKIYGDAGNDTIYNYNSGDNSYIDGGAGNDSIYAPDGNYVTITGGAGADSIKGKFWSSSIVGGADADKISLYGGGTKNTVKAGTGNDTIYSSITSGVMYQYAKGDGNDSIKGWTAKDTLNVTGGNYTTVKSGNNVQVKVGSGAVTLLNAAGKKLNIIGKKDTGSGSTQGKNISNVKDRVTLTGGAGNDTIYNTGKYVTVNAGNGNDSISGSYNYALINAGDGNDIVSVNGNYDNIYADAMGTYIKGGAGNDSILGGIDYGEVDAGTGNDVIRGSYHYSYISGGDGNDKIELSGINVSEGGYVNTINAGKGNDTISHDAKDKRGHIYQYAKGDGNDTIIAFSSFDTLHITSGSYTTSTVGNDLIVKVGSNSIRLKNALENPTNKIQIKDSAGKVTTYNNLSVITGTNGADYLSNKNSNRVTINALAGNDIILNDDGGYVVINAGDGNDSINNTGNYVTIKAGNGNDTITGTAFDSTVDAGAGNDFVSLEGGGGNGTKYELGAGNDTIYTLIWGTVNGGAGNDRISLGAGNPFTVNAGKGNDFIYSQAHAYVSVCDSVRVYQYANGDGNDTIISYSTADSLNITGSYTTKRKGKDVIVSVGNGSMLLKDFSGDTLNINGKSVTVGDGKGGDNKLIIGTEGADDISNTLSGATIKALGGNDTVSNTGVSLTAYMGAGNDSIYNTGEYATIYGDAGNDYFYNSGRYAKIYGGVGNDKIFNTSSGDYSYIDVGAGNDSIDVSDAGNYLTISGGAGADKIIGYLWNSSIASGADADEINLLYGGGDNTVNAGTGNDSIFSANYNGVFYQYAKGDGNDSIVGWNAKDTMSITGGSHKMSTVGNDVIVSITGGAKVTLSGAKGKTINVISESDDTAPTTPTSTVTAQEVIKKFMKSLDTTANSGVKALDEAVSVASGGYFTNIQSAINSMVNDIKTSSDSATFLLDKCGINLDNDDTGAITGYDAGSSKTAKTANSIVPESGSLKTYTGNSFNASDVTFKLADYNKFNDKYDTVSTINYSSLTNNAQKYIWNGLYTWWATSSLNLIADSYGDNYSFGVNSSATAKEIYFGFYNENSSTLAVTTGWTFSEGPDAGHTTKIGLFVNMNHFSDINTSDPNGNASGGYLDRTLAHEFTHAVMKANINYFDNLPQFIKEGMAELTHGIDDERYYSIKELAGNSTKLQNALTLSDLGTGDNNAYSGGYMFLRYLAKQGSEHYGVNSTSNANITSNAKALTAQSSNVSLSGNVLTVTSKPSDGVIDLTKYSSSVRNVDASKLTSGVMIIGNTYANSIKGGTGADTVSANTGNDTIYGGAGNDLIFGDAGNDKIYGDAGNDTLNGGTGTNTLTGGAGNDVFVHKYGDDLILDYTATQDKIKIVEESMNSVSVSGSNVIFNFANSSVTVKGGKGKDITLIDKDGTASTKKYNASMTFSTSNLAASSEFWFDDSDNFATDDTQIDAITTPTETNYSVTSVDLYANLDNLAQINELVTTQGYSGSLNKNKK